METRDVDDVRLLYPHGFINAHTVRVFEAAIQEAVQSRRFKPSWSTARASPTSRAPGSEP